MEYEAVIGLEVHAQLKTQTKVFCGCANEFGARENTNICPVCLGLPGSLPVFNAEVFKDAIKVALALGSCVRDSMKFDRKNYYYPDLPKGFQISQYDMPLAQGGFLDIDVRGGQKRVKIKRVHIEEDAGKLVHPQEAAYSLVDYNRAGTPLLEIVTEPDLKTSDEAYQYLSDLKLILQYLGVSDCDMEKGSLRCDANISLRPQGETQLGVKTELKNLNSFKAVKAGLEYEMERQRKILKTGERISQETRLWDEKKCETSSMRSKEEAHDYRYFPEPDLPVFSCSQDDLMKIRKGLPELPKARLARFMDLFGFSRKDAGILVCAKDLADFFEECLKVFYDPKRIANWLTGPVFRHMNEQGVSISALELNPEHFVKLIKKVEAGALSHLAGKDILKQMLKDRRDPEVIMVEKNLSQVSDVRELSKVIEEVVETNQKSVGDYLSGKENAIMFLVGQVMKRSKGKANPKVAKDLLRERLKK